MPPFGDNAIFRIRGKLYSSCAKVIFAALRRVVEKIYDKGQGRCALAGFWARSPNGCGQSPPQRKLRIGLQKATDRLRPTAKPSTQRKLRKSPAKAISYIAPIGGSCSFACAKVIFAALRRVVEESRKSNRRLRHHHHGERAAVLIEFSINTEYTYLYTYAV